MFDSTSFMNSAAFEWLDARSPRPHARYEVKFQAARKRIPAPGYGRGCHRSLLGVATLGILAGHTDDEIFVSIRVAIPEGKRMVGDKDIWDAIRRAHVDTVPAGSVPSDRSPVEISRRVRLSEAEAAKVKAQVLAYSTGPINLDSEEFRHAHGFHLERQAMGQLYPEAFTMLQLIQELFDPGDLLYIGPENMGSGLDNIRSAAEWLSFFDAQQKAILERVGNTDWNSPTPSAFLLNVGMRFSHIVPNPVTGRFGKTKDKKDSLRCDDSIRDFRYAVIDFDDYETIEEQGEVLHCLCESMDIRICALIHTGGRGCHAWVKIDGVDSLNAWNKKVRDSLFPTFEALSADPNCANPSRGSRLPGVYRWEPGSWQKLLFASREGVRI